LSTFLEKEETARPEENSSANLQLSDGAKGVVPPGSLDLLCRLFPEKKRSVLELVLRRCEHDLLKAIEHCVPLCKSLAATPKSRKTSTGNYVKNNILNNYVLYFEFNWSEKLFIVL